jgi:hypothetical protein
MDFNTLFAYALFTGYMYLLSYMVWVLKTMNEDHEHKELNEPEETTEETYMIDIMNFEMDMVREEMDQVKMAFDETIALMDKTHQAEMNQLRFAFDETKNQDVQNMDTDFHGLRPWRHLPVETLFTSLEQLMTSHGNNKHILSYLKELYCRGLLEDTPWWNYDHVTCSACMKRVYHNKISTCAVCSSARNLPLEEYKVHHDMIVQDQLWNIFRMLKPILQTKFEKLKKIKIM